MKTKALVVDDSRAMRMVLRQILSEFGFDVAEAVHGRDALSYLQSNPDTTLALVDWNMPEMNGLELVEAVRGDARLKDVRMMMVTTETEMSSVERAMRAGANEYIMKPFSKAAILEKLQMLGLSN
jgi:two-component system chemotaxis response regulator CheY